MNFIQSSIENLLVLSLAIPLFASLSISLGYLWSDPPEEKNTFWIARICSTLYFLFTFGSSGLYIYQSFHGGVDYVVVDSPFWPTSLFFDGISAVFLTLTSTISILIIFFSDRYMHREDGYHKFYILIFLLFFGMTVLVTSGTLDVLFGGWEIIALSSFLMIGFYRTRTSAARHALRALLTYRICDVGLLIGALLAHHWSQSGEHHLFEEIHKTATMGAGELDLAHFAVGCLLFLAAMGKSAQFPFSGWLPRAFEGPSNSSAVFYGALSIHAGVFLLLRTSEIWFPSLLLRYLLCGLGIISFGYASLIGRVQSNIKGQIAWASTAQVALIFFEIGLGLQTLALWHVAFNASLRSFQLLTSSSAMILETRFRLGAGRRSLIENRGKISHILNHQTLVFWSLQEFFLDSLFNRILIRPCLQLREFFSKDQESSQTLNFGTRYFETFSMLLLLEGLAYVVLNFEISPTHIIPFVLFASTFSFALSFLGMNHPQKLFFWGTSSLLFTAFAAFLLAPHELIGPFQATLVGLGAGALVVEGSLHFMSSRKTIGPDAETAMWGIGESFPRLSILFLVGFLATVTFPITGAFRGEDILLEVSFSHHHTLTMAIGLMTFVQQLLIIRGAAMTYFGNPKFSVQSRYTDISPMFCMLALIVIGAVYTMSFGLL